MSVLSPVTASGRRRAEAWPLAGCCFVLAGAAPLVLLLPPSPAAATGMVVASVAMIVYADIHLARLISRGEPRIFSGVYWMFMYVCMGVVPLAQTHTSAYPNLISTSYLLPAQLLALLGCAFFDIGQSVHRRQEPVLGPPAGAAKTRLWEVHPGRLSGLTAVALALSIYYIAKVGGPSSLFQSREDLNESLMRAGFNGASQVGQSFVTAFGQAPVIIAFVAWTLRMASTARGFRKPSWVIVWATLLACNIVVNNPISNSRYWFLTVMAGIVFSLRGFGPRLFRMSLIAGVLGALVIFPYSDYFRRSAKERGALNIEPLAQTLSTKDYDQSVMTANGVWYVHQFGHTFGAQLMSDLFFWVPRSIWPEKALDTGVLVGRHIAGAGTTNLSSPLWEEFYMDFGLVGVLVGFFLFGVMIRRADEVFASTRLQTSAASTPLVLEVILPFLAGYQFILLRGPLLQAMGRLAVMLAVAAFIRGRARARE